MKRYPLLYASLPFHLAESKCLLVYVPALSYNFPALSELKIPNRKVPAVGKPPPTNSTLPLIFIALPVFGATVSKPPLKIAQSVEAAVPPIPELPSNSPDITFQPPNLFP
jgi:hypothetical protein